jgi:hypothetical protein
MGTSDEPSIGRFSAQDLSTCETSSRSTRSTTNLSNGCSNFPCLLLDSMSSIGAIMDLKYMQTYYYNIRSLHRLALAIPTSSAFRLASNLYLSSSLPNEPFNRAIVLSRFALVSLKVSRRAFMSRSDLSIAIIRLAIMSILRSSKFCSDRVANSSFGLFAISWMVLFFVLGYCTGVELSRWSRGGSGDLGGGLDGGLTVVVMMNA